MQNKLSKINSLFFGLLIFQSLVLIVYLTILTFNSPYLQLLDQYSFILKLINFLLRFVFFCTALAFLILPADLIYEKGESEWLKFKDLVPMLLIPWLDSIYTYFTNPNFSFLLAVKKTAILWYVGGLLAYAAGFIIYGQIEKKQTLSKIILKTLVLFTPFILMSAYIYQNIWAYGWLHSKTEIISWHIALILYGRLFSLQSAPY